MMKNFNKIMKSFNKVVKKMDALSAKKRMQKKRMQGTIKNTGINMQDKIKSIEINMKDVSKEEAAASEFAAKLKKIMVYNQKIHRTANSAACELNRYL